MANRWSILDSRLMRVALKWMNMASLGEESQILGKASQGTWVYDNILCKVE